MQLTWYSGTSVLEGTAIWTSSTLSRHSGCSSRNSSKARSFWGMPLIMSSLSTPSITYIQTDYNHGPDYTMTTIELISQLNSQWMHRCEIKGAFWYARGVHSSEIVSGSGTQCKIDCLCGVWLHGISWDSLWGVCESFYEELVRILWECCGDKSVGGAHAKPVNPQHYLQANNQVWRGGGPVSQTLHSKEDSGWSPRHFLFLQTESLLSRRCLDLANPKNHMHTPTV